MGAWGVGSFDNDDAADFLAEVVDGKNLALAREVFTTVQSSAEYLEAPDASQAIAAAEVVAAALGRSTNTAQQQNELTNWVSRAKPAVDSELASEAAKVLDRILAENSELRELWEETEEFAQRQATVSDLRAKLKV